MRAERLIETCLESFDGAFHLRIARIEAVTAATGIRVTKDLSGIDEALAAPYPDRDASAALTPGRQPMEQGDVWLLAVLNR